MPPATPQPNSQHMELGNFRATLLEVKGLAFDVDGVLTNNQVLIAPSGELLRPANTRDGYALHQARLAGIPIAIITGGTSQSLVKRYANLGIEYIYPGAHDKVQCLQEFCACNDLAPAQVMYMGDDMPDLQAMQLVGMPCCPLDACSEIQNIARYISPFRGGEGCVRDIVEQILKLQGHWPANAADGRQ